MNEENGHLFDGPFYIIDEKEVVLSLAPIFHEHASTRKEFPIDF